MFQSNLQQTAIASTVVDQMLELHDSHAELKLWARFTSRIVQLLRKYSNFYRYRQEIVLNLFDRTSILRQIMSLKENNSIQINKFNRVLYEYELSRQVTTNEEDFIRNVKISTRVSKRDKDTGLNILEDKRESQVLLLLHRQYLSINRNLLVVHIDPSNICEHLEMIGLLYHRDTGQNYDAMIEAIMRRNHRASADIERYNESYTAWQKRSRGKLIRNNAQYHLNNRKTIRPSTLLSNVYQTHQGRFASMLAPARFQSTLSNLHKSLTNEISELANLTGSKSSHTNEDSKNLKIQEEKQIIGRKNTNISNKQPVKTTRSPLKIVRNNQFVKPQRSASPEKKSYEKPRVIERIKTNRYRRTIILNKTCISGDGVPHQLLTKKPMKIPVRTLDMLGDTTTVLKTPRLYTLQPWLTPHLSDCEILRSPIKQLHGGQNDPKLAIMLYESCNLHLQDFHDPKAYEKWCLENELK